MTHAVGQRSGFQLGFTYSKTSPIAQDPAAGRLLRSDDPGDPGRHPAAACPRCSPTARSSGRTWPRRPVPARTELTLTGEDVTGYMDLLDLTGLPFPAMPPFARVALMMAKYAAFGVDPGADPSLRSRRPRTPTRSIATSRAPTSSTPTSSPRRPATSSTSRPARCPGPTRRTGGRRSASALLAAGADHRHGPRLEHRQHELLAPTATRPCCRTRIVKVAGFSVPVPVPDIGILKPPLGGAAADARPRPSCSRPSG